MNGHDVTGGARDPGSEAKQSSSLTRLVPAAAIGGHPVPWAIHGRRC